MKIEELKLRRDLVQAAINMGPDEARFLVDAYYTIQEYRKAAANQTLALTGAEEPHALVAWISDSQRYLESQIKRALDRYTDEQPMGGWAKSIVGIGPVIAAGLLAHINLEPWRCRNPEAKRKCRPEEPCSPACGTERIESAGHIWSFAGLIPGQTWDKGHRRPWNAQLKTLCWKIGESFVKVSGNPNSLYGRIWAERKAYETARNEAGDYAAQARDKLERFRIGKNTEAYKHYSNGRLPPGHIHARAKRYAVKLFLAHWHEEAYRQRFGAPPPAPYPIEHLGHVHWMHADRAS